MSLSKRRTWPISTRSDDFTLFGNKPIRIEKKSQSFPAEKVGNLLTKQEQELFLEFDKQTYSQIERYQLKPFILQYRDFQKQSAKELNTVEEIMFVKSLLKIAMRLTKYHSEQLLTADAITTILNNLDIFARFAEGILDDAFKAGKFVEYFNWMMEVLKQDSNPRETFSKEIKKTKIMGIESEIKIIQNLKLSLLLSRALSRCESIVDDPDDEENKPALAKNKPPAC